MKFYKRISFWVFLLLAVPALFFILKKGLTSVEVKVEPLRRQTLEITVSSTQTGTIKSDKEVKVTAERQGRVSMLFVEEGDIVKQGSPIAELDAEEAGLSLQMSRASYEKAKAQLSNLKAAFEPFRVDMEAGIQKAEANLKEAEKKLKRMRDLREKGFISEMELDSAELSYNVAKADYDSSLSGRDLLKVKKQEVKAQEAVVREAHAALALSELNYKYSHIKAPITGVVSQRPVMLGDGLIKGALIATVVETGSFYIEAFIDEADVAKVKTAQDVRISMDAYPETALRGGVYMISPVVLGGGQEARTFEVRIRIKDKGLQTLVKPGMSADIEIVVDKVEAALVIPSQAVIEREGEKYVYRKEGGKARLRQVQTGLFNWTYTEIVSGIKEGDEVIVNPDAQGLKDGARVRASGIHN